MQVKDTIPRWVFFVIATPLGLWSTIQAFWLERLSANTDPQWWLFSHLLVLNLVYWYVPALAAPFVMRLASRYQLGLNRWPVQARVHAAGALVYAGVHSLVLLATRAILFPHSPIATGCGSCMLV